MSGRPGVPLLCTRIPPKVWRRVVDTLAPRVVLTANPTGAVYFDTASNGYRAAVSYVCGAQDRYLNDANFACPGTGLTPTRSFDNDPIVQSLFPDLTIRSGLVISYTVSLAAQSAPLLARR